MGVLGLRRVRLARPGWGAPTYTLFRPESVHLHVASAGNFCDSDSPPTMSTFTSYTSGC